MLGKQQQTPRRIVPKCVSLSVATCPFDSRNYQLSIQDVKLMNMPLCF